RGLSRTLRARGAGSQEQGGAPGLREEGTCGIAVLGELREEDCAHAKGERGVGAGVWQQRGAFGSTSRTASERMTNGGQYESASSCFAQAGVSFPRQDGSR